MCCVLAWLFLSIWLFLSSGQKETSGRLRSRRTRIPKKGRATGKEEPGKDEEQEEPRGAPEKPEPRAELWGREGKS